MLKRLKERYRSSRLIRRAIDTCPDGICFARPGGRLVLVNQAFNDVCTHLLGHTVANAEETWQALQALAPADPSGDATTADTLLLPVNGDEVWRFQRSEMRLRQERFIQMEASDVTELFSLRQRLRENNARLLEMNGRQRELLQSIVQNNIDQELLNVKMRIHDRFGQLLIWTKNAMTDGEADLSPLLDAWRAVAEDMENAAIPPSPASPRAELLKVAELIGCRVEFDGTEPRDRKALLLLYAAIREALTNAIRHAEADQLTVRITERKSAYVARISDNGKGGSFPIQEGGGLGGLRQRLAREGATLDYEYAQGLTMIVTIPKEVE